MSRPLSLWRRHRAHGVSWIAWHTPCRSTGRRLGAFDGLVRAGKVQVIDAPNSGAPRLAEALRVSAEACLPRLGSLQPLCSLIDRKVFEDELQPLCLAQAVAAQAAASL